ncbi:MAG: nuclear transport factor 2 family protein [Planctomycetota bacterium]
MTNTTEQQNLTRVLELNQWVQEGRALEAMGEFYSEDVRMQENTEAPTVGREANLERERAFMANVAEWKRYEVVSAASNGDVTFTETIMEFITQDGTKVRMEQATRARWEAGRIVDERFYHG